MWLALLLGLLQADADAGVERLPRLEVPLAATLEVEVGYAMGFRCDDVTIIEPSMRAKSDSMNVFVVKGLALGHTRCRVGLAVEGPTTLFDVVVVPKPNRR